jgi:ribosomal protein L7/L12
MSRDIRFPEAAVAALAKGQRLEAIKLVREANHGVDLRGAMEAVEAHASGRQGFPIDTHSFSADARMQALPAEALAAITRGQLGEAIRIVRQATGLGLQDARELVDAHRGDAPQAADPQLDDKLEEIAREHGVTIPSTAVAALNRGNVIEAIKLVHQSNRIGLDQARDAVRDHAGNSLPLGARKAPTVSMESNRHGWLWALLLLGAIAAAWVLLAR